MQGMETFAIAICPDIHKFARSLHQIPISWTCSASCIALQHLITTIPDGIVFWFTIITVKLYFCFVTECPPSHYGMFCNNTCSCPGRAECDHVSGQCLCPPGFYGKECKQGMYLIKILQGFMRSCYLFICPLDICLLTYKYKVYTRLQKQK